MITLLIFILACWGMTHILVVGSIFDPIRDYIIIRSKYLGKLIACHQCTGFWVGFFLSLIFRDLPPFPFYIGPIIYGFISSGVVTAVLMFLSSNRS